MDPVDEKSMPHRYAFPFDDNSSTFQYKIEDPRSNVNIVNYTITFCPDRRSLSRNVMTTSANSACGTWYIEIYPTNFAAATAVILFWIQLVAVFM